jgi:hypothetical protein
MQNSKNRNFSHKIGLAEKWHGPAAIIVSNLGLLTATFLLRRLGGGGDDAALKALFLANLFASVPFLWQQVGSGQLFRFSRPFELRIFTALLLWAASYIVNYALLVIFIHDVSITHLIIAEAIAPFIAVFAFRSARVQIVYPYDIYKIVLSVLVLVAIAYLETPNANQAASSKSWHLFGCMVLLFSVSQGSARYLSTRRSAAWTTLRLPLIITAGLGALLYLYPYENAATYSLPIILTGVAVGFVLIPLNRVAFLYGLAVTPAIMAALFISTTVPMSLFFKFFEDQEIGHKGISLALAAIYIFIINYFNSKANKATEVVPLPL